MWLTLQITGFFTLYALAFFARKIKSFISTLDRAAMLRKSSRSARIKRSVFTGLRRAYALAMLFGVHAMFRGILWELQAGMVIRYGTSDAASVLHVWDAWYVQHDFVLDLPGRIRLDSRCHLVRSPGAEIGVAMTVQADVSGPWESLSMCWKSRSENNSGSGTDRQPRSTDFTG